MKIADKLLPFMYIKEYAICNINDKNKNNTRTIFNKVIH